MEKEGLLTKLLKDSEFKQMYEEELEKQKKEMEEECPICKIGPGEKCIANVHMDKII